MREVLVGLLVGFLLGFAGAWASRNREMAEWRGRAEVEMALADSAMTVATMWRDSARVAQAEARRVVVDTVVLWRVRVRIDTALGAVLLATSLEECRTGALALGAACRTALDSAGAVVDSALTKAGRDSTAAVHALRADSTSQREVVRLRQLLVDTPKGVPTKWLGFLPRPGVTAGLGCAGGYRFGCGVAVVAGFTF